MRRLWTMTASDLRQRVRDKSVVIFAIIVPLALMFVMNLAFGGVEDVELGSVDVAVSVPADDQLGAALVQAVEANGAVEVRSEAVPADQVRDRVESGDVDLGLVVPDGFTADVTAGRGGEVELVQGNDVGLETDVLIAVVHGVLDQFTAGTVAATAGAQLGLGPDQLARIGEQAATAGPAIDLAAGEASSEQLSAAGTMVAGMAGMFLLFTVGFGVLGLIAEREEGTLVRLRSMPMHPGLIVAAKGLVSYILGVVATGVLLAAGSAMFGLSFGSVAAVAVLVLVVVAAGTSLMFTIARVARTAEQANIVQSILAIVLGMAGGAFFPISASGLAGSLLELNPVAAFIRGLGITTGGGGPAQIGTPVAIMAGFTIVCLAASRLLPDRGARL